MLPSSSAPYTKTIRIGNTTVASTSTAPRSSFRSELKNDIMTSPVKLHDIVYDVVRVARVDNLHQLCVDDGVRGRVYRFDQEELGERFHGQRSGRAVRLR